MQGADSCKFIAKVWKVTDTLQLIVELLAVSTLCKCNCGEVDRDQKAKFDRWVEYITYLEMTYYGTTESKRL